MGTVDSEASITGSEMLLVWWVCFCFGLQQGFLCHILDSFPLMCWAVFHTYVSSSAIYRSRKGALKSFHRSSNTLR